MRGVIMRVGAAFVTVVLTAGVAFADNYGGDGYNLTVGLLMSEQALVSQALSMPAVQVAVSVAAARGYTRQPAYDRAAQLINTIDVSGSFVVLAFSRPNTPQPADTLNMPFIIVNTTKAFPNDTPITYVAGSVMTLIHDAAADQVRGYCSENAPGAPYAASDPTFVVDSTPGADPLFGNATDTYTVQKWSWGKFLACEGIANGPILIGAAMAGGWCAVGGPLTATGCGVAYVIGESMIGAGCAYFATQ